MAVIRPQHLSCAEILDDAPRRWQLSSPFSAAFRRTGDDGDLELIEPSRGKASTEFDPPLAQERQALQTACLTPMRASPKAERAQLPQWNP